MSSDFAWFIGICMFIMTLNSCSISDDVQHMKREIERIEKHVKPETPY